MSTAAGADGSCAASKCARPTTSTRATGRCSRSPTCRTSSLTGLSSRRISVSSIRASSGRISARSIISITPSEGFALDREPSTEPTSSRSRSIRRGRHLRGGAFDTGPAAALSLGTDAYKDTVNAFTLYRGIVLGIAGLLALILTILFVVKGTAMLPLLQRSPGRCSAISAWISAFSKSSSASRPATTHMASGDRSGHGGEPGSLPLLLSHLNRWHTNLVYATLAWIGGLGLLAGVAVYDPAIAAGVARLSFALTAAAGVFLILFLHQAL